jgi:hypothetical protein
MNSATLPTDFRILVKEVYVEMRANGDEPVDALRCVIERNDLSDGDGVRLFSAIMSARRNAGDAAIWAA